MFVTKDMNSIENYVACHVCNTQSPRGVFKAQANLKPTITTGLYLAVMLYVNTIL